MNKNNIFENLPLTIVMILLSAATSFAVVSQKVASLEKQVEKSEGTLGEMREFRIEQRTKMEQTTEDMKELKSDIKEMLKIIRENDK